MSHSPRMSSSRPPPHPHPRLSLHVLVAPVLQTKPSDDVSSTPPLTPSTPPLTPTTPPLKSAINDPLCPFPPIIPPHHPPHHPPLLVTNSSYAMSTHHLLSSERSPSPVEWDNVTPPSHAHGTPTQTATSASALLPSRDIEEPISPTSEPTKSWYIIYQRHIIVTTFLLLFIAVGVTVALTILKNKSSPSSTSTPITNAYSPTFMPPKNNNTQPTIQPTSIPTPTPTRIPCTGVGCHGMAYHNGSVMENPVTLYYIFYGNWSTSHPAFTILPQFIHDLSSSSGQQYWSIATSYYTYNYTTNTSIPATSNITYGGSTIIQPYYPFTMNLTDTHVYLILRDVIHDGRLGHNRTDPNAIYMLITSADVYQQSFCKSYCGWHYAWQGMKYLFVGDASVQCPTGCLPQDNTIVSPNGDVASDGMINMIAHEIIETITNPEGNAWQNGRTWGMDENADICVWRWGQTYNTSNGALANVKMGTRNYLLQEIWVNEAGGYCGLHSTAWNT